MADYTLTDGVLTVLPGTRYIRSQEFSEREDIRKVVIPAGVGFMEDECFTGCPGLETVVLPEGLVNIGPAAFGDCTGLREVQLPRSLRSIDSGAFLFCSSLKHIAFPDSLESIGEMAFQDSGLTEVCIPASVARIEECAFFSCESLRRAEVLGAETEIGRDAFGCNDLLTEGYIAPGYPADPDAAAQLLYTLLWCSCPTRHGQAVSARAQSYIRNNQQLIMERILKMNNIPAMTGLAELGLLEPDIIASGFVEALKNGRTELSALLLKMQQSVRRDEEEFAL